MFKIIFTEIFKSGVKELRDQTPPLPFVVLESSKRFFHRINNSQDLCQT